MSGKIDVLNILIKSGADVNLKVNGQPPLQQAIRGGRLDIVKALLDAGANANDVGTTKDSMLKCAILRGKPEIVKVLRSYGAKENIYLGITE